MPGGISAQHPAFAPLNADSVVEGRIMGETGFCPNCGSFTIGMTPFCVNCGARLEASEKLRQYGSVDATVIGGSGLPVSGVTSGLSRLGIAPSPMSAAVLSPAGNISHRAQHQQAAHRGPQRPVSWRKIVLLAAAFTAVLALSAGTGGIYLFVHRNDAVIATCEKAADHLLDANDALKVATTKAQGFTTAETSLAAGTSELTAWQTLQGGAPTAAKVPACSTLTAAASIRSATTAANASAATIDSYAKQLTASTASLRDLISTQQILAKSQARAAAAQPQE
jgi:hypothetical protein